MKLLFTIALAIPAVAADPVFTPTQLREFGAQYCFGCHDGKKQKGDFNFEPHAAKGDVPGARKVWEKVAEMLETREMPPEDKKQPSEEQRLALIKWIDSQLSHGDTGEKNPGRVTLRRLNKDEYRNTIRDLLAVEFNPVDFPNDETAYGYDTIAEALSLPPLLMEKYLSAAEEITTRALANDKLGPPSKKVRGADFKSTNAEWVRPLDNSVLGFYREGDATLETRFEGDGEFLLRFRAYGEQAGPEAPKLAVALDGASVAEFDVKARGKAATYETKVSAKDGARKITLSYLNNYNQTNHPDPKMRGDRNAFVTAVEIIGPLHVTQQPPESYRHIFTKLPQPGEESKTARELLGAFASRAYRRPATTSEIARLGKIADSVLAQKAPFTEAVGVGVQAVLCSPAFLFRWELDPSTLKPGDVRSLGDYEVASRLSYFLWSSMPDDELLGLAAKGALLKDGNLQKQTARMLKDWRSQALVRNFSSQWLQLRAIDEVDLDEKKFPKFNGQLREAMKEESRLFFDAIMREDRSIFDLIEADFTFANERLAALYGLPGVSGDKLQRVSLPPGSPRGGVLGQGAVLVATSMPTRTSPVVRGKWVLEQLLGTPPPPAPANVPPLEETKVDASASMRVRLEQHRQNPDCATCHDKIDPVGFALENFDAMGAWRTMDGAAPIDTSGTLPGGVKLSGLADLKKHVKGGKFARNFTQQLMTYALGRGLERYDKAAIDAAVAQTAAGENKFSALVNAIVTSDPFLKRKR